MTGKANWSALNGIPFVDRILSFEDFCQLIPNEDFYLHFSKSKKIYFGRGSSTIATNC